MDNMVNYITLREAVTRHLLSEKDCIYLAYLLTIILKKVLYDTKGGGFFNINPETVLVSKKEGGEVKAQLVGIENVHESCHGKPDFDTDILNPCFRAPESFLGIFSPASDVYAMGMLLAYMIQGNYPYHIDESMPKDCQQGSLQKAKRQI